MKKEKIRMSEKPVIRKFPVDLYKRGLKVFFGDIEDFVAEIKKDGYECDKDVIEMSEKSEMLTVVMPLGDVAIWGRKKPETNGEISVFLHEIFHATGFLLRAVDIEHTSDTEEAYAYLFENLTLRTLTWIFE